MNYLLNRTTAPQAIRFFDVCFKQGVIDAYEFGNDIDAREFYEQKKEDWTFGILGKPDDFDWQQFRYQMYFLARRGKLKSLAEGYIFNIRNRNYLWCLLLYCMRFYLMGIDEWLRYPNPAGLGIFKVKQKIHWDPNEPVRNITKVDIISYLHEFEHDYSRLPEEEMPVSAVTMSSFVSALFDLSRKYVTGEEEDLSSGA